MSVHLKINLQFGVLLPSPICFIFSTCSSWSVLISLQMSIANLLGPPDKQHYYPTVTLSTLDPKHSLISSATEAQFMCILCVCLAAKRHWGQRWRCLFSCPTLLPVFEVEEVKVVLLGLHRREGQNRNRDKVISCVRPCSLRMLRWIGWMWFNF